MAEGDEQEVVDEQEEVCEECWGDGCVDCYECMGTGNVVCETCNGKGTKPKKGSHD